MSWHHAHTGYFKRFEKKIKVTSPFIIFIFSIICSFIFKEETFYLMYSKYSINACYGMLLGVCIKMM